MGGRRTGTGPGAPAPRHARSCPGTRAHTLHNTRAGGWRGRGRGAGSGSGHGKGKGSLPMHRDKRVLSRAGYVARLYLHPPLERTPLRQDTGIRGYGDQHLHPLSVQWILAMHPHLLAWFVVFGTGGGEKGSRALCHILHHHPFIHSRAKLASKLPATPTSDLCPRPTLISPAWKHRCGT